MNVQEYAAKLLAAATSPPALPGIRVRNAQGRLTRQSMVTLARAQQAAIDDVVRQAREALRP